MLESLKRTEVEIGKRVKIESSFSGLFKETFWIPKKSIDHLAVKNFIRAREALLFVVLAYAAFLFGMSGVALALLLISVAFLLTVRPTKVLVTGAGQGIKLYLGEEEWEKLKGLA